MSDVADQICDLLPHGTFDVRVYQEPSGATVLKVICRCGRALDWAGALPGWLLFDWLANHRDEMFLTEEQLQATYQAKVRLPMVTNGVLAALGLPEIKPGELA